MDVVEYLRAFRKRWAIIVVTFIVACSAALLTVRVAPPVKVVTSYEATSVVMANMNSSVMTPTDASASNISNLQTIATLVTTGPVPERVAKRLDYKDDPQLLAGQIMAEADPATGLLKIRASSGSEAEALSLANTFTEELLGFLRDRNEEIADSKADGLSSSIDRLKKDIQSLDRRIRSSPPAETEVLNAERSAKIAQYGILFEVYQGLSTAASDSGGLELLQPARAIPISTGGLSSQAGPRTRLGLAGIFGLMAGAAIVLILERFDQRLHTKARAGKHFRVPILAEIPLVGQRDRDALDPAADRDTVVADSFRALATAAGPRTPLRPVATDGVEEADGERPQREEEGRPEGELESPRVVRLQGWPLRIVHDNGQRRRAIDRVDPHGTPSVPPQTPAPTILVTSAGPGEGKSTVVANLAATYAELGRRVIVMSCDFRRPTLHRIFEMENAPGLSEAVAEHADPVLNGHLMPTGLRNVALVPSGASPNNPPELVNSDAMREAIAEAQLKADVVLIDSAPLLVASETSLLLPEVDGVLLVAHAGRTTTDAAERASELLNQLDAPVLGVTLNASESKHFPRGYQRYVGVEDQRRGFPRLARHWKRT